MWGEDRKKGFHFGNYIFQRVCWVIFYYCFIILCIFHPLWMSTKRNQATQKNFQATQLWVEAHRLRTMDLDGSNYSYASYFSLIIYIYCWNKNKRKHLINPEHCFANKQINKKCFDTNYKSQQRNWPKIFSKFIFFNFLLFYFDLQLKQTLFIFLLKQTEKATAFRWRPFFGFHLKLTIKLLHFIVFKPHPPNKIFCATSLQAHYSGAGPASNCLMQPKQA